MKLLAANHIVAYEKSKEALEHYYQTVKFGLATCLLQSMPLVENKVVGLKRSGAVIFGSDLGLVGQFNDQIAEYAYHIMKTAPNEKIIWSVGERVHSLLKKYTDLKLKDPFNVPTSIPSISTLIGQILDSIEQEQTLQEIDQLLIFYNKPKSKANFEPTCLSILPIDEKWLMSFKIEKWPTNQLPEMMDDIESTFSALIREHFFTSLFKACVESLISENTSRFATMQAAEHHIEDLLEQLHLKFNLERQNNIDEELFDVISGFEVIMANNTTRKNITIA
jgi:F-type H+-transporting ATPase subunit gamma